MFRFTVPTPNGVKNISVEPGSSVIIVGANGSGKSRLAVQIENNNALKAHRISAHRMLVLNTDIPKVSEELAKEVLLIGANISRQNFGKDYDLSNRDNQNFNQIRYNSRWKQKTNAPLDDFTSLLQFLFAEHANIAVKIMDGIQEGKPTGNTKTKINTLKSIWQNLLPSRTLRITADDILVKIPETDIEYKASELSEGERAIFYLIGQTLVAEPETLLIFDEPELHIHRSIMSSLWDELEAARPDCGFIFITHDLEFAASRAATKYVIREYNGSCWNIEEVPEETGFDEETTTFILGSRRPILFVEGTRDSLDLPIYRGCYPEWTIIPKGSCSEVKHSVVTLNGNAAFTRIMAQGIADADSYTAAEIANLQQSGIKILPVSEIENLFLLPSVGRAILETDAHNEDEIKSRLERLKNAIFEKITSHGEIERATIRHVRRRIDRELKILSFEDSTNIECLYTQYKTKTSNLDVNKIAENYAKSLNEAIDQNDICKVLLLYDNKGLLSDAASILKSQKLSVFKEWIVRVITSNKFPKINSALNSALPILKISPNN